MVPDESDKMERYVGGLPNSIHGSVMVSKPKILQEAIELARSLMDLKVLVYAARQAKNKRKIDNNPRNNHVQQPPYKRQNVARAYTAGPGEKMEYAGTSDCPKLKNKNRGNAAGNGEARRRAYALGGVNLNSNIDTGTFLLNNRYASILFDTGADKFFVNYI
ncbi:hypothetical protein Tco_1174198 [Tanacetum coccineum]